VAGAQSSTKSYPRSSAFIRGSIVFAFCYALYAGPTDFGRAELDAALAARSLSLRITTEMSTEAPECFRIENNRILGGDLRGLMYGMLEAAEQIRNTGHLATTKICPATPIRGIRTFVHSADVEQQHTREYWLAFIQMLARNRFNRLNLVFAHQTDYLAPPYPFWLDLKSFPQIKARNLTDEQRRHNLEMLQYISQTSAAHGIDFTLGIWEHNIQPNMKPSVDGITPENIGPYSYEALKTLLDLCPDIRSVQMRTNAESGIPADRQVAFYRDYVFRALHDAGHLAVLDLRGWVMSPGLLEAATNAGVPLRLSSKYWAEDLGRPYQPPETWSNYSYINFLEKTTKLAEQPRIDPIAPSLPVTVAHQQHQRPWHFYWELWALGSHRLLLWGDPDYVRRAVSTFTMSDTDGFEIDAPLAQKGFGNAPSAWVLPSSGRFEFERYWMFYLLWGRLSYDPKTPDKLWSAELERRFGSAASAVLQAYHSASNILTEIVAAHLADPNMYIWPEINPGGLIESYREIRPSDWAFIAGISEAVKNRINGVASAKQTPLDTATRFHEFARKTDAAVEQASKSIGPGNKEWEYTANDFRILSTLAQYHARKQMAADQLTYFYETSDDTGLYAARRELVGAQRMWEQIVKLTDGAYPPDMSFAPDDKGHWKDKLPYVQHDIALLDERIKIWEKFGGFDYGFDFGGPVHALGFGYRSGESVWGNNIEPRFRAIDPKSSNWITEGPREAIAMPLASYLTVRAVAKNPTDLPKNALFGDSIRGSGPQVFRVTATAGQYKIIFLNPDQSAREETVKATDNTLDIHFPEGDWNVAGLIVKKIGPQPEQQPERWPLPVPRPTIEHTAPTDAAPGKPLVLALHINPIANVRSVRLHYRPVNQLAQFKVIEQEPGKLSFTIPADDVSPRWDLMYYFEILNKEKTGWFFPDPQIATPYYVVPVVTSPPQQLPKESPAKSPSGVASPPNRARKAAAQNK
jgi:hypothetical protein